MKLIYVICMAALFASCSGETKPMGGGMASLGAAATSATGSDEYSISDQDVALLKSKGLLSAQEEAALK